MDFGVFSLKVFNQYPENVPYATLPGTVNDAQNSHFYLWLFCAYGYTKGMII